MTSKPRSPSRPASQVRIGLALAGGGPLGAVYEIGALCALQESLAGIDLTRLQHYVGVSAGGFIAAALANRMTPTEICAAFIEGRGPESFDPSWLMVPAYGEYLRRSLLLPGLGLQALWDLGIKRRSPTLALEKLGPALPTGVFSNDEIDRQLARLFSRKGRTNDFRQLPTQLTLVATCLDTAEAAPFGQPGWDHVPISRAVQASAALPGLFPPVEIDGEFYVDGALKKTLHASVALDDGMDLMLCLNPLVPYDTSARDLPRVVDGGLPAVLSQTFRSMIHSRMALGMKHYERLYPHTDIVLIEPDHRDPHLYLANTFSYSQRRGMAEHAYQTTRAMLRDQAQTLEPKLTRHGITLRHAVLNDSRRTLSASQGRRRTPLGRALDQLHHTLDDLQQHAGPSAPAR